VLVLEEEEAEVDKGQRKHSVYLTMSRSFEGRAFVLRFITIKSAIAFSNLVLITSKCARAMSSKYGAFAPTK
jgi:hypothetical protein